MRVVGSVKIYDIAFDFISLSYRYMLIRIRQTAKSRTAF